LGLVTGTLAGGSGDVASVSTMLWWRFLDGDGGSASSTNVGAFDVVSEIKVLRSSLMCMLGFCGVWLIGWFGECCDSLLLYSRLRCGDSLIQLVGDD